jgi:hypothetical protein
MNHDRLKRLAGMVSEAEAGKLSIGLFFKLQDQSNMRKALDALLEAGFSVDLNFSMGTYFFNFKNEDAAEEAHKIASKVIDKAKEAKIEKDN